MCQQGPNEIKSYRRQELRDIQETWRKHTEGIEILSSEEIKELAVQKLMAMET